MNTLRTMAVCLLYLSVAAHVSYAEAAQPEVRIVQRSGGFTLMRNGQPFFIKGAGGRAQHLDETVAAGANSIREWSPDEETLERWRQQGMTALVGRTKVFRGEGLTISLRRRFSDNPMRRSPSCIFSSLIPLYSSGAFGQRS